MFSSCWLILLHSWNVTFQFSRLWNTRLLTWLEDIQISCKKCNCAFFYLNRAFLVSQSEESRRWNDAVVKAANQALLPRPRETRCIAAPAADSLQQCLNHLEKNHLFILEEEQLGLDIVTKILTIKKKTVLHFSYLPNASKRRGVSSMEICENWATWVRSK